MILFYVVARDLARSGAPGFFMLPVWITLYLFGALIVGAVWLLVKLLVWLYRWFRRRRSERVIPATPTWTEPQDDPNWRSPYPQDDFEPDLGVRWLI